MFTNTQREESPNPNLDKALVRMSSYTADLAVSVGRHAASNKSFRTFLEGGRPARQEHEIPKIDFDE